MKTSKTKLAKIAIKQYVGIKKYFEAVKKILNDSLAITEGEQMDEFKKDCINEIHAYNIFEEIQRKNTVEFKNISRFV